MFREIETPFNAKLHADRFTDSKCTHSWLNARVFEKENVFFLKCKDLY